MPKGSAPFWPSGQPVLVVVKRWVDRGVDREADREIGGGRQRLAISSRTGSKYCLNRAGFSLIGKCPILAITVAFDPLIRAAVASILSGVHEQSYSPDIR